MWSHLAFVWVESHCSAWMSIFLSTAFDMHSQLPPPFSPLEVSPAHISYSPCGPNLRVSGGIATLPCLYGKYLPISHSFRIPSHTSATALSSQCRDVSAHHNPTSTPISLSPQNSVSNAFHSHSCSFHSDLCLPVSIHPTCTRFSPGSSHKRISTLAVGHGSVKAVLGSASTGRRIITMRTYCARPFFSQRPRNCSSLAGDPAKALYVMCIPAVSLRVCVHVWFSAAMWSQEKVGDAYGSWGGQPFL
jgi:hypothetical protein